VSGSGVPHGPSLISSGLGVQNGPAERLSGVRGHRGRFSTYSQRGKCRGLACYPWRGGWIGGAGSVETSCIRLLRTNHRFDRVIIVVNSQQEHCLPSLCAALVHPPSDRPARDKVWHSLAVGCGRICGAGVIKTIEGRPRAPAGFPLRRGMSLGVQRAERQHAGEGVAVKWT